MSGISLPPMPRLPSKAKFWKKRSANISEYDPTFRVIYLGNVLTGWAKGDGCVDKPLATLWKNHMTTEKPNIIMKVTVCASGLKATTKEHGLTEYWAHRITFCEAEPSYPKVFCWIYRHEGRKMKQELRCHAVLCPSENKARLMAKRLKERLHQALVDFKKEKVWRQNARLSLANAADEQKTMPFRKIMLQAGSSNYRPPLEKGKSAPKLKVIEEVILEEDEDQLSEDEATITQDPDLIHPITSQRSEEDTNHITRLRIDSSFLTNSDSMPLLAASSACTSSSDLTSSYSMDQLSTMTAVTSFIDEVVISSDPSPEVHRKFDEIHRNFDEVPGDDSDGLQHIQDEEEDEVTDYLEKLKVEAETEIGDTISDESGYSEESSPSSTTKDEDFDLTVKGVLISDFSPSERLKYLQRSQSTSSRTRDKQKLDSNSGPASADFFQNKVPEFCIQI